MNKDNIGTLRLVCGWLIWDIDSTYGYMLENYVLDQPVMRMLLDCYMSVISNSHSDDGVCDPLTWDHQRSQHGQLHTLILLNVTCERVDY